MDEELYHFGIKGMKWGVRRTPEQLGHKLGHKRGHKRGKKRDAGGDAEDTGSAAGKGAGKGGGTGTSGAKASRYGELKDKLDRKEISKRDYDEAILRGIDNATDPKDLERYYRDNDWDRIQAGDRSYLAKVSPKGKNSYGSDMLGSTRYKLLSKKLADDLELVSKGERPKHNLTDLDVTLNYASIDDADALEYDIPERVSKKEYDRARKLLGDQGARDYYYELAYNKYPMDTPDHNSAYERISKGQENYERILNDEIERELAERKALRTSPPTPEPPKKKWPWQKAEPIAKPEPIIDEDYSNPNNWRNGHVDDSPPPPLPKGVKKDYKQLSWKDARRMVREGKMSDDEFNERMFLGKINTPDDGWFGWDGNTEDSRDYWNWYRKTYGVKEKDPREYEDNEDSFYDALATSAEVGKFKTVKKGIDAGSEYVDTSRLKAIRRMAAEEAKLAAEGKPTKYVPARVQKLAESVLTDEVMDVDELFGVNVPGNSLKLARKLLGDQGAKDFFMELEFRPSESVGGSKEDTYWRIKAGQEYLDKFLRWELDKELRGALGYDISHW